MRRIPFFLVAVAMLFALAVTVSAQTPRTFGARRFLLDDGTNTPAGLVYMTDNNGSLGVDNTGIVTLGTFPSSCALLDLSSTTKGLLPPRMTGAQEAAICGGTPPLGLLVYNTSSNTLDLYTGTWAPILGGQSWLLGGNLILPGGGGTAPGQSFIGTNDASDFVIATSGTERARVIGVAGPNQGWVGINTITPGSLLDVNGTLNSTGNSTIGTSFGTTNTFGDNGGAVNTIGTGANSNTIGQSAQFNFIGNSGTLINQFGNSGNQNEFGDFAAINWYGFASTTNNFGSQASTNNIGVDATQNNMGNRTSAGVTNNNYGIAPGAGMTTNNAYGNAGAGATANNTFGGTTGSITNTITGTTPNAITLNVNSVANNLVLNNIAPGANTDAALLDMTSIPSGNVRTRTISSLITGSNGVEVTYPTASGADAHFAPTNAGVVFATSRFVNTGAQVLNITGNSGGAGTTFASFNGNTDIVGINNNGTNNGTTTIGNTTVGGTVAINSSVSTTHTSPTNTMTATAAGGNNLTATAGQNTLIGQTGNTMTATTGNNTLGAAAVNALIGGTGNTVTATTGNNVLTTNAAGQNNLVANGAGGQNNLSANSATGQNNITANVAGGSNNIVGATNINNNQNFNTQISTGTSTGTTTIGSAVAGAISLQSNAATAISLNVTNTVNNLQLGNILAGTNGDAAFLDMTAVPTGNVRTRTIGSIITSSSGVNTVYTGSSVDVQLASAAGLAIYASDRFLNTAGFTTHFDNGGVDYATLSSASIGLNNGGANAGTTTIGNTTVGGAVAINSSVSTSHTSPTNSITSTSGGNTITANVVGNTITANTTNTLNATNGNNVLNAAVGNNNLNANGAASQNNITSTATGSNNINGPTNINIATGSTTNIATVTAATTNIGTAGNATNNIGNGGGATTNTIGNSANTNTFGASASNNFIGTGAGLNTVGQGAATNQFGASANSNQFGQGANTNQFGLNSPSNTLGTAGVSTNAINGTLNINIASAQLTTNGNGATGMHELINGFVDAALTDGIGNSHWDFQVTGDAFISGRTRLFNDVLASASFTVTGGGTTLNNGLVVNLGATINNGGTINNGTTLNNLPANLDNFMLTTPVTGGGIVSTRQVSTLPFVGGQIPIVTTNLAVAYVVQPADYLIICTNAAGGNVTLPAAAGATGKVYVVKVTNAAVLVTPAAGSIDGAANKNMNGAMQVAAFASDGANWFVVSN